MCSSRSRRVSSAPEPPPFAAAGTANILCQVCFNLASSAFNLIGEAGASFWAWMGWKRAPMAP